MHSDLAKEATIGSLSCKLNHKIDKSVSSLGLQVASQLDIGCRRMRTPAVSSLLVFLGISCNRMNESNRERERAARKTTNL